MGTRALAIMALFGGFALCADAIAQPAELGSPAQTAKRKRCPKRTIAIKLNRRRACLKRSALPRLRKPASLKAARLKVAGSLTSKKFLRRTLGSRGYRRVRRALPGSRRLLTRTLGALPAAAARKGPRARSAAPDSHSEAAPPGWVGGTLSGTNSDGQGRSARMSFGGLVPECPDPGGDLRGNAQVRMRLETTAPIPGPGRRRANLVIDVKGSAKLTGHVGSDAKLRDYDMDLAFSSFAQLRVLGPAGLEHKGTTAPFDVGARIVLAGLKPHVFPDISKPPHLRSFSLQDRGANDLETRERLVSGTSELTASIAAVLVWTKSQADDVFDKAQKVYDDGAGCLSVQFTPAVLAMTRGSTSPVAASVVDRTGAPVSMGLAATASQATVSPPFASASTLAPARFNLTPQATADSASMTVEGTSIRGRARGFISGGVSSNRIFMYSVSITGSGDYAEDTSQKFTNGDHIDHHRSDPNFQFSASWPSVIVPADGGPPASPSSYVANTHTLSGSAHDDGLDSASGDSYDCDDGDLSPPSPGENHFVVGAPSGGSYPLTINGFYLLTAPSGSFTCTRSGNFFSSYSPVAAGQSNDFAGRTAATAHLTPAQLERPSFTVPLTGPSYPLNCDDASSSFDCTHTLTWTGTATFNRITTCRRSGTTYVCGGPGARRR